MGRDKGATVFLGGGQGKKEKKKNDEIAMFATSTCINLYMTVFLEALSGTSCKVRLP